MGGLLKNIGDALTDSLGLNEFNSGTTSDEFSVLKSSYIDSETDDVQAHIEKMEPVPGSYSLFNPFRIFRYSAFGLTEGDYKREMHFDSKGVPSNPGASMLDGLIGKFSNDEDGVNDSIKAKVRLQPFVEAKKEHENPTASDIIRWSHKGEAMSPVPYSPQDFLWCKYYGKVPNNRLITLRRYPMPVEDDIRIHKDKAPMVPIAQAVSWYGSDINNKLSDICKVNWGLKWDDISASVQDIQGNEITIEEVAEAAGLEGAEKSKVIQTLKKFVFSGQDTVDYLKLAGYDKEILAYIKTSYGTDGPYWNRILGPINVIDKTKIRTAGFVDQTDITLTFEYSLRSHGGVNPKIAFLDLLTNFLSLTYNSAPFWGGGARYFQKAGVTVPNLGAEGAMLAGDTDQAIVDGMTAIAALSQAGAEGLVAFAQEIGAGKYNTDGVVDQQKVEDAKEKRDNALSDTYKKSETSKMIGKALSPRLGKIMRKPLIYRSILDGRAVGEWHITIGNPMNPMMMMGNMILKTVDLTMGDVLGIDDFPTEFKFLVKLGHGRPRAKQDIESMFNLGNGGMGFSQLAPPSSAKNSYGEYTTAKMNAAAEGIDSDSPAARGVYEQYLDERLTKPSFEDTNVIDQNSKIGDTNTFDINSSGTLAQTVARYAKQVGRQYGGFYGESPILTDYFKNLKTKD